MNDERLPEALRGLDMTEEPLNLPRAGGLMPVIIKAGLSDRYKVRISFALQISSTVGS